MKVHKHIVVTTYQTSFDVAETAALMRHPEFARWVGVSTEKERGVPRGHPKSSAHLTLSQLQRIAIYLDVDYRLVNDRCIEILHGDASPARAIVAGVAKEGAESKVDRLRVGAPT